MKVDQISVFLENKPGRVAKVTKTLADANVNIRALSVADTVDYGLLRLIVDNPETAKNALANAGIKAAITYVIAVKLPDKPGGLNSIIEIFAEANINIEYMYAFFGKTGEDAIVIFRVNDVDEANKILNKKKVCILSKDDIKRL